MAWTPGSLLCFTAEGATQTYCGVPRNGPRIFRAGPPVQLGTLPQTAVPVSRLHGMPRPGAALGPPARQAMRAVSSVILLLSFTLSLSPVLSY